MVRTGEIYRHDQRTSCKSEHWVLFLFHAFFFFFLFFWSELTTETHIHESYSDYHQMILVNSLQIPRSSVGKHIRIIWCNDWLNGSKPWYTQIILVIGAVFLGVRRSLWCFGWPRTYFSTNSSDHNNGQEALPNMFSRNSQLHWFKRDSSKGEKGIRREIYKESPKMAKTGDTEHARPGNTGTLPSTSAV